MEDKIYLFRKLNHFISEEDETEETHRLAREALVDKYKKYYPGTPLYMDVTMNYDDHSERVIAQVLAHSGYTFLVDKNPLHQYVSGIYFVLTEEKSKNLNWLDESFKGRYTAGTHTEIMDTYTSWDVIHNLYVLKSDVRNKNNKQALTLLI